MTPGLRRAVICVAASWLVMFVAVTLCRPLMPVDETRYLSVAWEMLQQGNWVLPTLNYEPYSHKPPLLFWLVRTGWEIFGISVTSARILIFVAVGFLFYLTMRLARTLFPGEEDIDARAILTLAAMPIFLIYASVIMFDSLLAVFIVSTMLVIWHAGQNGGRIKYFLGFGALLGIGILAKGPVALIYGLPVALLAPLWLSGMNWKHWYGGVFLALVAASVIGLAWAIPAAIQGGPAYAEKIFVTQSAGRMVKAFDHVEPFWFYIPVLAGFLLPLLAWPKMWEGMRARGKESLDLQPVRFLLCWVMPVFVFFSAISSKQIHYMIPILPGFAVLAAWFLGQIKTGARTEASRWSAIPLVLMLLPSAAIIVFEDMGRPFFGMKLDEASEHIGYAHIVLSGLFFTWAMLKPGRNLIGITMGSVLLAIMIHVQLAERFLPRFDLTPIAQAVQEYKGRPMAATPKYDGEYGFVFRATHHIASIGREDAPEWFAENPDGIVIGRYKMGHVPPEYNVLFSQMFRTSEELVIMEKK